LSWRRFWKEMSLHSKIVIWVTSILLVGGSLFLLISEWAYTLQGLPLWEKVLASFFQSVTPRTAGFNTLDISSMNNVTLLGTILLMFIGASPGSCGGGIKTSSLGVMLALSRSRLSGSGQVHAFKRSIPSATIDRAFGMFVISVMIVIIGAALLLITEGGELPLRASRGAFLELLFETTSAFGTVGLSMGVTSSLTSWGKLILVLIMFTGRLGPLVIAMAIQSAPGRAQFRYAEERVMIG
jgi:trk system potassium uptake protein